MIVMMMMMVKMEMSDDDLSSMQVLFTAFSLTPQLAIVAMLAVLN